MPFTSLIPDLASRKMKRSQSVSGAVFMQPRSKAVARPTVVSPKTKVKPKSFQPLAPDFHRRQQTSRLPRGKPHVPPLRTGADSRRINHAQPDAAVQEPEPQPQGLWISRCSTLQAKYRTGWVVAHMIDEVLKEAEYCKACSFRTLERAQEAGVWSLLTTSKAPRNGARCLPDYQVARRTCCESTRRG